MTMQMQIRLKAMKKPSSMPAGILQRSCFYCPKKRQLLQRRAMRNSKAEAVPPIVHKVLRAQGQPLDKKTLGFMEPRFRHDFSRVRVHTDAKAARSTQAVNALAYTVGQDIFFGSGLYSPMADEGQELLAHELAHVIQQSPWQSRGGSLDDLEISGPEDSLEASATELSKQKAGTLLGSKSVQSSVLKLQRSSDEDEGAPDAGLPGGLPDEQSSVAEPYDEESYLSDERVAKGLPEEQSPVPEPYDYEPYYEPDAGIPDTGLPDESLPGGLPDDQNPTPSPDAEEPYSSDEGTPDAGDACGEVFCPSPESLGLPRNPWIASKAKCRGACGKDCPDTCNQGNDIEICAWDSTGNCSAACIYSVLECGSHQGCREHDDCYDECARNGDWSGLCHRGCDIDCIVRYGSSNCLSWMNGGGPYDRVTRYYENKNWTGVMPCAPMLFEF